MAAMYVGTSPPSNINDEDLHQKLNPDYDVEEQNSMTSSNSSTTLSQKYLVTTNSNNSIIIMSRSDENSCRSGIDRKRTNSVIQQQPEAVFDPPDGGFQAYIVMICSFLCNGVIFGIINSYGSLFTVLKQSYEQQNSSEASSKAALVGSLAVGMTFLLSAPSSLLVDKFGIRKTAFVGGVFAFLGMFLSAFAVKDGLINDEKVNSAANETVNNLETVDSDVPLPSWVLNITYGLMFGGGASLVYTPSLVILGHYFKKHMGKVNGIVASGSSIFTMVMPHILKGSLESFGLRNTFFFLSGLVAILILASLSFISLMPSNLSSATVNDDKKAGCCGKLFNVDNWKNKKYLIWSLAFSSGLFGYFVPFVHIVQHVEDTLPEKNGRTLVTCIAITSLVGRLIFGYIADLPKVNRILLQQVSFVSIGICTMLLTAAPLFQGFNFESMILFSLIMGLFDGCFITMLGPIAFDICGPSGASQAIGFLLGLCSIPLTLGPPIAGYLKDHLKNYNVAFILAGIPPIVGAIFMCLIYKIKIPTPNINDDTTTINPVLLESEQRVQSLTGSATETTNLSSMENDKNFETESLLDNDTTEAVPRNSYIVVEKKC